MTTPVNQGTPSLYEQDFCLWLEKTANLLRSRQLYRLDYDHL